MNRARHNAWALRRLVFTVVLCAAGALGGCAFKVTPPAGPLSCATSVLVADYGYHASLLLPREDGGTVEYAYGEYDWFALNHDAPWRAPFVVFLGGGGALGRGRIEAPCTRRSLERLLAADQLIELRVERDRVIALIRALDARFDGGGPAIENAVVGLSFTRDPQRYWLGHNCNAELVAWLRELGCKVEGSSLAAEFRVTTAPVP